MDDALFVRGFQCFGYLPGNTERFLDRQRPGGDALGQRGTFDQFEDKAADAVGFLQPVDGSDVGVVEGS